MWQKITLGSAPLNSFATVGVSVLLPVTELGMSLYNCSLIEKYEQFGFYRKKKIEEIAEL